MDKRKFKVKATSQEVVIGDTIEEFSTVDTKYGYKNIREVIEITENNISALIKDGILEEVTPNYYSYLFAKLGSKVGIKSVSDVRFIYNFLHLLYTDSPTTFNHCVLNTIKTQLKGFTNAKTKDFYFIGSDERIYTADIRGFFCFGFFKTYEDAKNALSILKDIKERFLKEWAQVNNE